MNNNLKMNTTIDFEFCDGRKVPLTLTFHSLYQLRSKNSYLYKRYNEVMTKMSKGNYDELDMCVILYTAYMCANSDDENLLNEEEFIMLLGSDRTALGKAVQELTSPKKQKVFDNRSSKGHTQINQK